MKEYLATILAQAKSGEADELLDQWLDWAARSRLAPFVRLARTIRKHAVGILAYLDTQPPEQAAQRAPRERGKRLRKRVSQPVGIEG